MEDKLADGGSAARDGRDPEFVDRAGEGLGSKGLARAATGEQPAGRVVGGGAHVGPMVDVLEERCRDTVALQEGGALACKVVTLASLLPLPKIAAEARLWCRSLARGRRDRQYTG